MPPEQKDIVADFTQSADNEKVISLIIKQGRSYRQLKELGLTPQLHYPFKARLVKVVLVDGTVEILLTSLTDRGKYPHGDFKWLYN